MSGAGFLGALEVGIGVVVGGAVVVGIGVVGGLIVGQGADTHSIGVVVGGRFVGGGFVGQGANAHTGGTLITVEPSEHTLVSSVHTTGSWDSLTHPRLSNRIIKTKMTMPFLKHMPPRLSWE